MQKQKILLVAMASLIAAANAQAHVSFDANNAYAGKRYLATATIPHGCEDLNGAQYDTLRIEMMIPAGVTEVRPADMPNWAVSSEKDANGNVTKLIWIKTSEALPTDEMIYRLTFRGTLPAEPFTTLEFETTQFCVGDTTKTWSGEDVPMFKVLPARVPGWNKFTAQKALTLDDIKTYFSDAEIVWSGNASYSVNPEVAKLITSPLSSVSAGGVIWVKY